MLGSDFLTSSSGTGNGWDYNQGVHSDVQQCGRGSPTIPENNLNQNSSKVDVPPSIYFSDRQSVFTDGARKGQDSAQVHVDDESGVTAGDFWRRRSPGSLHGEEEAAARTLSSNKWVSFGSHRNRGASSVKVHFNPSRTVTVWLPKPSVCR